MNLAIVLEILSQISTSPSNIWDNDILRNMHRLNVSDKNLETTDDACNKINETIIEPSANPNNHEIFMRIDVGDCETKETGLAYQVDRNFSKPKICAHEENEIGCSKNHKRKNIQTEKFQTNMFPVDESSYSGSFSEPDNSNYIIRANKKTQSQDETKTCDNKIIKVGFSTNEILEFIRAKKEETINEDKCLVDEEELKLYFDFLENQLAELNIKITSKELRRKFLYDYISAKKERMLFYNTYEMFENEINILIEQSGMIPCADRIARDKAVAKEIIRTIQYRTCFILSNQDFISSELEFDLFVRFNLSMIYRFVNKSCKVCLLLSETKFLKDRVKCEFADFNYLKPSDTEIEAFVLEKINLMDNGINKIQMDKKEFIVEQKYKQYKAITEKLYNFNKI